MNIRQFIQTKSMKTIVGLFFLALLFGASDARAQCDGPKRVAFQRGLTTAVLKGAIPASKAICDQVRGVYATSAAQDSTVTGTLRGNVLTGRWSEPSGKGTFRFTLDPDGRSFTGRFGLGGDSKNAGEWDGHCQ